jgi:predicted secreted hydrolase
MRRDLFVLAAVIVALVVWLGWQTRDESAYEGRLSAGGLLSDAPGTFRQVTGPRPFEFPQDHAAHPGYRSEWWYFTGQLEDRQGREFGFQFTLFRFELDSAPRPDSDWHADAVWMGHLAVSDIGEARFLQSERFARGALGLAGASESRWWLRDWQVRREGGTYILRAGDESIELQLELRPRRPIVTQGESGYSRKGPEPGNASHYYSITRLEAEGTLRLDGRAHRVAGRAWLDREWGSSQLGPDLAGWDWFSLQLDDGRDVMVYRLRTHEGEASRFSAGKVVYPNGESRTLEAADFTTRPLRRWRDESGVEWPVAWQVDLPSENLSMTVRPRFDDQRWRGSVSYWEGAMTVEDDSGERLGLGYLELSGYAD